VSDKKIMVWRDNRWVEADLIVMPPHMNHKPEECDRCNAELHELLSQLRPMRRVDGEK
jgi:hypothetical protein